MTDSYCYKCYSVQQGTIRTIENEGGLKAGFSSDEPKYDLWIGYENGKCQRIFYSDRDKAEEWVTE